MVIIGIIACVFIILVLGRIINYVRKFFSKPSCYEVMSSLHVLVVLYEKLPNAYSPDYIDRLLADWKIAACYDEFFNTDGIERLRSLRERDLTPSKEGDYFLKRIDEIEKGKHRDDVGAVDTVKLLKMYE